jgi:hypothetical protein
MPRIDFNALPDHGRLWVFPAGRRLSPEEASRLQEEADAFLDSWAAHGAPLRSGRELWERQFLLVGVDGEVEAPSGCSIDALVGRLRDVGRDFDVTLVDHSAVWYRDGGSVRVASRADFRGLTEAGDVDPDTPVFDTTLTRLSELRSRGLERPARDSWHGPVFFRTRSSG